MTSPLRVVDTPGDRAVRIRQANDLRVLIGEHRIRGEVLAEERKRILHELHDQGMSISRIAKATGHRRYDVARLLRGES